MIRLLTRADEIYRPLQTRTRLIVVDVRRSLLNGLITPRQVGLQCFRAHHVLLRSHAILGSLA